jgi:eukaryotic-like serine/threonine-protein kinase
MVAECSIIGEIAKGGQKNVFRARHPEKGGVVIKRGDIKSISSLERIQREIDLLSELSSPYYPAQYHFCVDMKTKKFEIVEEYIEGMLLRDCIHHFTTVPQILNFLLHLCDGLNIIWDKNIVHRDIKPENIILRTNGLPCILDLGIARFLDMESLTQTISPLGPCTPIYAAPEQLNNQKNIIDHRTDFFALGILALELYYKFHPFDPEYVKNDNSIVENILSNQYVVAVNSTDGSDVLMAFAKKTLRLQPFERCRNYILLRDFLTQHI